jgi:hypothetical protein
MDRSTVIAQDKNEPNIPPDGVKHAKVRPLNG